MKIAMNSRLIPHKSYIGASYGPPLPFSFEAACTSREWSAAIDEEYQALIKRNTWKYIPCKPGEHAPPFKWIFRAKQIDEAGREFTFKA